METFRLASWWVMRTPVVWSASPIRRSVQGQLNQPVTGANFREDLNADGRIKKPDVQVVKTNKGHSIP